jgi:hypothetical protein
LQTTHQLEAAVAAALVTQPENREPQARATPERLAAQGFLIAARAPVVAAALAAQARLAFR